MPKSGKTALFQGILHCLYGFPLEEGQELLHLLMGMGVKGLDFFIVKGKTTKLMIHLEQKLHPFALRELIGRVYRKTKLPLDFLPVFLLVLREIGLIYSFPLHFLIGKFSFFSLSSLNGQFHGSLRISSECPALNMQFSFSY